jgi:hypothetical protein
VSGLVELLLGVTGQAKVVPGLNVLGDRFNEPSQDGFRVSKALALKMFLRFAE